MQEIDELVESVKLDAIKEEKKLDKPFTPNVKKESAPKAAPAEEKKPVKKEAVHFALIYPDFSNRFETKHPKKHL